MLLRSHKLVADDLSEVEPGLEPIMFL